MNTKKIVDDALKLAQKANGGSIASYEDKPHPKMTGFDWRPLRDVHRDIGEISEIPSHVEAFGSFMDETARKAATKGLEPRDLLKAYLITRASIQRQAIGADKVRDAGLILPEGIDKIRPEGAMGEWLHSKMGQRYLDQAELGKVDHEAVAHAQQVMKPFGKMTETEALPWAAENLSKQHREVSDMVARALKNNSTADEWLAFTKGVPGIGPSKSGFLASMLGRGDQPTLDARQVILQTGMSTKEAANPIKRAGPAAVDRLADRQAAMNLRGPKELEPFRQHLTHHAIWDAAGNEKTTHDDVIRAMRGAKSGGRIGRADGGRLIMPAHEHPLGRAIMEGIHKTPTQDIVRRAMELAPKTGFTRRGADVMARDPRLLEGAPMLTDIKPTSKSGHLITPMQEMEASYVPKGNLMPERTADIERMQREGAYIVPLVGDRTPAGTLLTGYQGKNLSDPVNQQGGPDYMRSEFAAGDDPSGWRSRLSASKRMQGAVSKLAGEGPVYGAHVAMGIKAADSSHMMLHSVLRQIPSLKIRAADLKAFDKEMREKFPHSDQFPMPWPGIKNVEKVHDFFYNQPGNVKERPGKHVSEFVQNMDSVRWRSKGFPDVGAARFANIDPHLIAEPQLATGASIARLDPSTKRLQPNTPERAHQTYTHGMPGTYEGRFKAMVPGEELFRGSYGLSDTPTTIQHALMTKMPAVKVDQRVVDLVKAAEEDRMKRYGFKDGGAVNPEPTEAQKRAGNYKKHHISFQGLPVSIENPKGSVRKGTGWQVKVPYHYGYIKRTEGADGDHVDVCIGPHDQSEAVFIVDQKDLKTGAFDEHKVMLGFRTREEALDHYVRGFSDGKGRDRVGAVVRMTMPEFKSWLKNHDTKKPVRGQGHIDRALALSSVYTAGHNRNAG
jgi:hypothetical protein